MMTNAAWGNQNKAKSHKVLVEKVRFQLMFCIALCAAVATNCAMGRRYVSLHTIVRSIVRKEQLRELAKRLAAASP